MDNVFPASYIQINLHIDMCVFSYNPLVLDSHPSINCVPFIKATLAMECPKPHDPFVFQFSHLQFPFLWPALCNFSLVVSK